MHGDTERTTFTFCGRPVLSIRVSRTGKPVYFPLQGFRFGSTRVKVNGSKIPLLVRRGLPVQSRECSSTRPAIGATATRNTKNNARRGGRRFIVSPVRRALLAARYAWTP